MTTDKKTLDLAREWAADIDADRQTLSQDTIDAAADLISSLPDTIVDGDKLRELADEMANWLLPLNITVQEERQRLVDLLDHFTDRIHNLLADSSPRTLADLPDEWVSVDELRKYISDWRAGLATAPRGSYEGEMLDDLEDMLPAPPAPESASPRPEDVPVGEPWQVEVDGQEAIGYRTASGGVMWPWQVVFPRGEGGDDGWSADEDVTLIARLVPETTEQDDAAHAQKEEANE